MDGELIYQIARGDPIMIEGRDREGKPMKQETVYDLDRFPFYQEGYFGFRMVGTHHLYTHFRVYALEPEDSAAARFGGGEAESTQSSIRTGNALKHRPD